MSKEDILNHPLNYDIIQIFMRKDLGNGTDDIEIETIYLHEEFEHEKYGKSISLADIQARCRKKGYKRIDVICENPLIGIIYRYGNHGAMWEVVGNTVGYA